MLTLNVTNNFGWSGVITLGIFEDNRTEKTSLSDDKAFFYAVQSGLIRCKRMLEVENTVTNYARQYMVSMLTNSISYPIAVPSQMELGTGSGTPSQSDTDLFSPSAGTLKPCSGIRPYLTYYAQYVTTWQSTDPIQGTWTEIGLFDENMNLWAHSILSSNVAIKSGEILVAQWNVQIKGD